MELKIFVKSPTVKLNNYTIKDIPGSSGRLDVVSRCILAALLSKDGFEEEIEIWVFLDNYGTYIFNSERFDFDAFPKNEIKLTDYFVKFLRMDDSNIDKKINPLNAIEVSDLNIIDAIKEAGVRFIPGSPVGGPGHFRTLLLPPLEYIEKAYDNLEKFMKKRKK